MATSKSKRPINLSLRRAQITNLNLTTEAHGKDQRVSRCDVSLKFLLEDVDIPEIVDAKGNALKVLWHDDGTPMLRELADLKLGIKAKGEAGLGLDNEHVIQFEDAVLKAVKVKPLMKYQAEISCQVRVDPTERLELLDDMLVAGEGVFTFDGSGVEQPDKDQQDLDV